MAINTTTDCFLNAVTVPVKIIDVASSDSTVTSISQFVDAESLRQFLATDSNYSCRFISICQRNSWTPLHITKEMLDLLKETHLIDDSFDELPSCFYKRSLDLEETFCIPWTQNCSDLSEEVLYSVRYPEHKPADDEWTIRQTGLYHQMQKGRSKNMYILFNPRPNSKAQLWAESYIQDNSLEIANNPFWLHGIIFEAYSPAWRQYSLYHEKTFLPIVNNTSASFIDEDLPVNHETLRKFTSLRNKFLQIPIILAQTAEVLQELATFAEENDKFALSKQNVRLVAQVKNRQRQCTTLIRTTTYLQQRAQVMAEFCSGTLSLRDQVVGKHQNASMIRLNKSAVFITALTLLYLPSSWLATFFGMNFFAMDQDSHRLLASPMIWIYATCSVVLTVATIVSYFLLIKRDGKFFSSLAPKASLRIDMKTTRLADLGRRFTMTRTRTNLADEKELPV